MCENPIKISMETTLKDAVELFDNLHVRHIIVINPKDGKIAGIVTRKDLFAYMEPP